MFNIINYNHTAININLNVICDCFEYITDKKKCLYIYILEVWEEAC